VETNLTNLSRIFKQEGTSRLERYSTDLDPENVLVDHRRLEDFIVYAQRYSKNLLFVNTEQEHGGIEPESWDFFFKDDVVLLIANIATKNVGAYKDSYDHLLLRFRNNPSLANFAELVAYVLSRFQKINSWYYSSAQGSSLHNDLTLYIRSYLRKELEALREMLFYVNELANVNYSSEEFYIDLFDNGHYPGLSEDITNYKKQQRSSAGGLRNQVLASIESILTLNDSWELNDKPNSKIRESLFTGTNQEEKLQNAALKLNGMFDAVFHAIQTISETCHRYFEETIDRKSDHAPHVAFLITFIKLFGYVSEALNKLPRKHLDYYYQEILRIKKKEAIPDQVFVVFDLAKGFETGELKKGTLLAAGKDKSGADVLFTLDKDIVINKANVTDLNTIFIEKDLNDPAQTINYYQRRLTAARLDDAAAAGTQASSKLFGDRSTGTIGEIGFAIASTQFYLAKGERNVVVNFGLQDDVSIESFDPTLIKLLLTGEKGWISSEDTKSRMMIQSLKKIAEKTIELHFSISIAQEQNIVAFDPGIHEGNFITGMPVLQCILKYPLRKADFTDQDFDNWRDKILQLNILQRLKIQRTSIVVQVGSVDASISFDGVTELVIENQESFLNSKKPFFPFTALPAVGASFYIGCKDMYYKPIDKLSVNIEWMLPDNFRYHYQSYLPPYDSNKFTASLSILQDQFWKKIKDVSIIDTDSKDPAYRSLKIDIAEVAAKPDHRSPTAVSAFDNDKKNGTLQLKLNYPDFGHAIYPQLITSVVMEKASSKSSTVNFEKLVKKELKDSRITIKLPVDIENRNGSLKVIVYDVLDHVVNDVQARTMLINGLGREIKKVNGSNILARKNKSASPEDDEGIEDVNTILVNDENLISRILRRLKKVRFVAPEKHHDHDKETASDIVDDVKDRINQEVDFILPSDREMITVIGNETNSAINKTVANIADELLELRKSKNAVPYPEEIAEVITKAFRNANEVINDMIAKKIAIILSANEVPRQPYTPLISNIAVSYSSHKNSEEGGDQFFYVTPFGVTEIYLLQKQLDGKHDQILTNYIFPRSIVTNDPAKGEMAGMLFIGIKDLLVNQNLSLLVQLAEGTKLNDKKPPEIIWWYLRNNKWIMLDDDAIISDSTFGFQTTGIIEIAVPPDANTKHALFETDMVFWICVSVQHDTDAFPELINIKTQSATATFKDHGNDPSHLALPLEAGKIKNLLNKVAFVKGVSQPVSSVGGSTSEDEQNYYTRVSERLRHKARAVNNWDYERLVLQRFPFLYKVKCINNYHAGSFAVGHITIVPIADLRNKNYPGSNILLPRTNYLDLRLIEKYLLTITPPFVKVHAVNPRLDHVLINCKVKFHTGVDKGFYLQKLNDDLVKFLSPWATGEMETISFSGKIYSSAIIHFIDKRTYVDYVAELVMKQYTLDEFGNRVFVAEDDQLESLVETQVTTNHSLLVSAPKHEIELIE